MSAPARHTLAMSSGRPARARDLSGIALVVGPGNGNLGFGRLDRGGV
jgi:hypothetical protein